MNGDPQTLLSKDQRLPAFMRRELDRAIEDALHPRGMSTHDGKARVPVATLQRMLAIIDGASSSETFAGTPWVNGPPKEPGSHVVHYESGYYAVLTLTADSMVLRSRRNDNPYGIVRHFRFDVSAQKASGHCSICLTESTHMKHSAGAWWHVWPDGRQQQCAAQNG